MLGRRKWNLILVVLYTGFASSIDVQIGGEWQNGFGWNITCNWNLPRNDRVQSVRLSSTFIRNQEDIFLLYRPEVHGLTLTKTIPSKEFTMNIECAQIERASFNGFCIILVEPHIPPKDSVVSCEVSGEGPRFREGRASFNAKAFVPPRKAEFTKINVVQDTNRVFLNCTSAGIPAPRLDWTVSDDQHKVQPHFKDVIWNDTLKLWKVWSSFNYSPQNDDTMKVTCTPSVETAVGTEVGLPAVFSSGVRVTECLCLLLATLQIITMTR